MRDRVSLQPAAPGNTMLSKASEIPKFLLISTLAGLDGTRRAFTCQGQAPVHDEITYNQRQTKESHKAMQACFDRKAEVFIIALHSVIKWLLVDKKHSSMLPQKEKSSALHGLIKLMVHIHYHSIRQSDIHPWPHQSCFKESPHALLRTLGGPTFIKPGEIIK